MTWTTATEQFHRGLRPNGNGSIADKVRSATNGHMALLGSPEFINYLQSYKYELHRELHKQYQTAYGNVDGLVNMYTAARYIVPSIFEINQDNPTVQIARQVTAKLAISPKTIYSAAKAERDPLARASTYRVFADVADNNDANRPWALNNAAHILLDQGHFVSAREVGKSAVDAANLTNHLQGTKIKAKAGLITAVAAERLADFDTAKEFGTIALENGNARAARFTQ
jgi:hypothetical protein